jgi:predicted ArsR family transcriptional regulator
VLGQLAAAGLVQPVDVRNGPGRPRRVYRPTAG